MKTKLNFIKTGLLCAVVLHALTSGAQTFSTIRSFGVLTNITGFNPQSQLVQGPDGTLYGTTSSGEGGLNGASTGVGNVQGTVFKINSNGSGFTVIKLFTNSIEGVNPQAGVILSGSTLYGTTYDGGTYGYGTVFMVNTNGTGYTVLNHFNGNSGDSNPKGDLTLSGSTLYGTTSGSSGVGSVFKLNTNGTGYTVMKTFIGSDGGSPYAGVVLSGSVLYGTTYDGGSSGYGTVFKVNTNGTGFVVLKSFTSSDAANPYAGVTLSGSTLYGTTSGTVFKLNTDGTGYTILKSFTSSELPQAGVTLSGSTLYGTTGQGGNSGIFGTVFKVNTDGTGYTVLYNFAGFGYAGEVNDGWQPHAGVILSGSTLYGTTFYGGSSLSFGTIFKVNLDGTGYAVLKNLTYSDGANPNAAMRLSGNTLYGTTYGGGSSSAGTVFKVNTDGTAYTVFENFARYNGGYTYAGVTLSSNTLYGTTGQVWNSGTGTIFKVNTDGTGYTVLWTFNGSDGAAPQASLTLSGSTLYGTTASGGSSGDYGTVFKVNTDGTGYTVLKNFTAIANGTNSGGANPRASLALSSNTLYGTTGNGGSSGGGTVFKVNIDGSGFTVLKNFAGSDGANPGSLILSGSVLFGTTYGGGSSSAGTVFKINMDGTAYTVLKNFTGGSGGAEPAGGAILSGSKLYGTTYSGGSSNFGTVYAINTDGTGFTVMKSFTGSDGANPDSALTLSGGEIFGTTSGGGIIDNGTIFKITLPASPSITNTLVDITAFAGTTTNFTVRVSGTAPFSYQWYFNSAPLATATNATLPFAPAVTNQTGNYFVIVTNAYGAVTSSVVVLTVVDPKPVITNQPPDLTLPIGNTASFGVGATGVAPLKYQWSFNNGLYAGATNGTLAFGPALTNQAGNYQVIITNLYGSATSRVAVLTVLLQPNAYGISKGTGSGSGISLSLASIPGSLSRVWASTNLVQWQSIATNVVGANGLFQFTDTNLTGKPTKYYRVSTP